MPYTTVPNKNSKSALSKVSSTSLRDASAEINTDLSLDAISNNGFLLVRAFGNHRIFVRISGHCATAPTSSLPIFFATSARQQTADINCQSRSAASDVTSRKSDFPEPQADKITLPSRKILRDCLKIGARIFSPQVENNRMRENMKNSGTPNQTNLTNLLFFRWPRGFFGRKKAQKYSKMKNLLTEVPSVFLNLFAPFCG